MDEHEIARVAAYHMIDADAVRGFIVDMVATAAAPDAGSALNAVYTILDGAMAYSRVLTGDSDYMPTRLAWDRVTDRQVEDGLTEAWAVTRDQAAQDGYKGKHRA